MVFEENKYKHMHTIQYTANPNSATTDKKVRNVSACLYGDFRQVGGVDIYKFSVLLLFCMDFRVGCLLLCCCYMYNMYFFFVFEQALYGYLLYDYITFELFPSELEFRIDHKNMKMKSCYMEMDGRERERDEKRYSKVLCGYMCVCVCVRIINTKTSKQAKHQLTNLCVHKQQ